MDNFATQRSLETLKQEKMELKGKTILITGGGAGIGLESAKQMLAAGAKVIITGRDQTKLDKAKKLYPSLIAIQSDVADAEGAKDLYKKVIELGGIDILYNNAGVGSPPANLAMASDKHYEHAAYEMNINYLGVIRLTNLFVDHLKSKNGTAIIITSSILSYLPSILGPTYSATKAAVRFYTESLREHFKIIGSSVKVFELLPPLVATDMTESFDAPKLSPEDLVKALLNSLAKDQYTIRVGATKVVYLLNRFFPKLAFGMLNNKKFNHLLK
jgi:uncharacterized oxidoreductase